MDDSLRRRTVLQGTVAGIATGLGASMAGAQEHGHIELEGYTTGWVGVSPQEIEGEENPPLELTAGETYTLTWENGDGVGHNFVIEDETGEERFVETEIVAGTGEVQEVEFTAEAEMAAYFCEPHPQTMRGPVEVTAAGEEPVDEEEEVAGETIFEEGPTVGLEVVTDQLTAPIDLVTAEDGTGDMYLLDQTGMVHVIENGQLREEPFLDVTDEMVDIETDFDERGLLGLAFHPDYGETCEVFVRYSAEGDEPEYGAPGAEVPAEVDHLDRLSRFEASDGTVDPESEEVLLEIPQPQFNHNAGPIVFGPDDGYLYVTTGDGGGAGDAVEGHVDDWYDEIEGGNGQDTQRNLLGGILRIDVDDEGDDERAYGIPDDNPLVGYDEHLPEYYAWGLRNPWGMSFENGQLLAADVGQALFEIINHVEAGGNYGWNPWEGTHCFDPDTPEDPPAECPDRVADDVPEPRGGEPLLGPVIEYPQEAEAGRYADEFDGAGGLNEGRDRIGTAIIGGHLYEGDAVEDLSGTYVFGDWSWDGSGGGRLFIARPPEEWGDDHEDDEYGDADVDREENGHEETQDENDEYDDTADVDRGENGPEETPDEDDEYGEEADEEADLERYHPPDQVDLWPMEELSVEGEGLAEDGQLTQYVYAIGRDDDGEVYVLTSDTATVEGTGYVSRIVPAEGEQT